MAAALLVGAPGCGSSSSKAGGAPPSTAATTSGSATSARSATTVAVPGLKVDLVLTGTKSVTIKGTKGTCHISTSPDFGTEVDLSGADYPSMGSAGALSIEAPHTNRFVGGTSTANPGLVKFDISGTGGISGETPTISVSADKKTVTLDTTIDGTSGTATVHENIKGTIVCS
jgi:hypothetical protein